MRLKQLVLGRDDDLDHRIAVVEARFSVSLFAGKPGDFSRRHNRRRSSPERKKWHTDGHGG
jgi:hypothetical protein